MFEKVWKKTWKWAEGVEMPKEMAAYRKRLSHALHVEPGDLYPIVSRDRVVACWYHADLGFFRSAEILLGSGFFYTEYGE